MKQLAMAALAVVGLMGASSSAQAFLVSNGGFELNDKTVATNGVGGTSYGPGLFGVHTPGSQGIDDWTVTATSVDIVNGGDVFAGSQALDLVGTPGPGGVSQVLTTGATGSYTVSFWAKGTWGLNNEVYVTLGSAATQLVNITGTYAQYSVTFTNPGAGALLTFASNSLNTGTGNTFIDEVEAVPEPATMAVLALLAAVASRKRKA